MRRVALAVTLVLVPALAGCVGLAARAARAAQGPPSLDRLLADADENHDGMITRAEFRDARGRLFMRLDRNGDGYIDAADEAGRPMRRRQARTRMSGVLQALDKNGDGRISRDEFVDGPTLAFDRADLDHDGVVDGRELAAFKTAAGAR